MVQGDGENSERDAHTTHKREQRIFISIALTDVLWFFLDVWFVWPISHVFALWVFFGFIAIQIAALPFGSWRLRYGLALAVLLISAISQAFLPPVLPLETEFSGELLPANDPSPQNACWNESLPPEATIFLLGTNAMWTLKRDFTALTVGDCTKVQIKRTDNGLLISADIFAADGNMVAHISDNKFKLIQNEMSYAEDRTTDRSTLAVHDPKGNEAFYIRWLNAQTIDLRGHFFCGRAVLIADAKRNVTFGSNTFTTNCKQSLPDGFHFWLSGRGGPSFSF